MDVVRLNVYFAFPCVNMLLRSFVKVVASLFLVDVSLQAVSNQSEKI